jgi:ADP-L-glycero-D-manno-heptose 6-epimerase
MQYHDTIVITGAAGFIGSYLAGYLNSLGYDNLILVDDFDTERKALNLSKKKYIEKVHRDDFFAWAEKSNSIIKYVFHLGARTDTTEMDYSVHKRLNLDYSKAVWQLCTIYQIPLIYASSAATYGNGEYGYIDSHDIVDKLSPLNPYGISKNQFDAWALTQSTQPPFWAGLKFFNVYGPNEYHKGRMASVIFHAYHQIRENNKMRLFRSHKPGYADGEQQRDFIYVKDIASICYWLMQYQPESGLYNAGTGKARSFNDLAKAIFSALHITESIEYIDTPADIRDKYQYFTEADMAKLQAAGYPYSFHTLEEGINNYLSTYLEKGSYF